MVLSEVKPLTWDLTATCDRMVKLEHSHGMSRSIRCLNERRNENLCMARKKNFHTKPCVFTA